MNTKDVIAQAEKGLRVDFVQCELLDEKLTEADKNKIVDWFLSKYSSYTKDLLQSVVGEMGDKIKHKFNGFGGILGFTQSELLDLVALSDIISKLK